MQIRTTRFGQLEVLDVPEQALLTFPDGLPGFEAEREFALIEDAHYQPFCWLQSVADPSVRFLLIDPALLMPDYDLPLEDGELASLGVGREAAPRLLCILTVPSDLRAMTANLRAPLVVNLEARRGKQLILAEERYPLRHPVFEPAEASLASCSS
jgi:flagellar assembly factor FliW